MRPLRSAEQEVVLLDTTVDSTVDFTALSVLPEVTLGPGRAETCVGSSSTLPAVPVAGSKEWLPSMVDVGRKEALLREMSSEGTHHNAFDGDSGGGHSGGHNGGHNACEAFFAVDVECVLHKYRRWHECFPRVKPFYAVKCNPNRAVVRALAMSPGCGFDVASSAEMDQVLDCGVDPSRVIYANPCKDLAALDHALSAGIVTMTFDSKDELHKIRRQLDARAKVQVQVRGLNGGEVQKVQMVLRLRVPDDHSNCPLGEKYGAIEQNCSGLIALAIDLRLPLVGVSFHCGSGCEDAQAYPSALVMARAVFDLAAQQGLQLTLLDIGGGFPGWDGSESVYHPPSLAAAVGDGSPSNGAAMREAEGGDGSDGGGDSSGGGSGGDIAAAGEVAAPPLSLAEVAKVTVPVLDRLFPPSSGVKVIAEPGRYLVEASHILFARIYAKRRLTLRGSDGTSSSSTGDAGGVSSHGQRQRRTTAYFIGEGVHGCFKDRMLCDVNYEPCPVSSPKQPPREEESASSPPLLGTEAVGFGEQQQLPTEAVDEEEEDAMVMGPSGLPTDMVARKRLPKSLAPGDWLYFSRMGAYTASIATVASSAALHASYCYVAGTPAAAETDCVQGGCLETSCVGVGSVDRERQSFAAMVPAAV